MKGLFPKHLVQNTGTFSKFPVGNCMGKFPIIGKKLRLGIPHLGYFWEGFHSLDVIIGFFGGKKCCFLPNPNIVNIMGIFSHVIPKDENNMGIFSHVIPKDENNMGIFSHIIPNVENNMGIFSHNIPNVENSMGIFSHIIPKLRIKGEYFPIRFPS